MNQISTAADPPALAYAKPRITTRRTPAAGLPRIRIMGIDFTAATEEETVALFVDSARERIGCWVVTANLDHLRRYSHERLTRELIHEADVVVADGMPVVAASRLAGVPLPERVAGSSMVRAISRRAADTGASVFLLGGEPGIADQAGDLLRAESPRLRIAGTHCPPHGFEDDPDEMAAIGSAVVIAQPDIVLVALSFPKTDRLIRDLRRLLPGASFMGVGIALSFICGDRRRAPEWMQRAGVEWLHRLLTEPGRLWRRYLVQGLPFAARLLAAALVARAQGALGGPWFAHASGGGTPVIGAPRD